MQQANNSNASEIHPQLSGCSSSSKGDSLCVIPYSLGMLLLLFEPTHLWETNTGRQSENQFQTGPPHFDVHRAVDASNVLNFFKALSSSAVQECPTHLCWASFCSHGIRGNHWHPWPHTENSAQFLHIGSFATELQPRKLRTAFTINLHILSF